MNYLNSSKASVFENIGWKITTDVEENFGFSFLHMLYMCKVRV